jgi:2',3'-cyclic-nucleotide 2'-phosphodiesterase (5'-nucleotidase family)
MPSRRTVLAGLGASALALGPSAGARGQTLIRATGPFLNVFVLSDVHSAYDRLPQLLAAIDAEIAGARGVPPLIVVNGDVFERGNSVALRSEGVLDWEFLVALRQRAQVVLNLGNHETALLDDMATVVGLAQDRGVTVVSNILDQRSGRPFAPSSVTLDVDGRRVAVVGIATDEMNTYRAPVRPTISVPDPAAWGTRNLPALLRQHDFKVVLSHAGVWADRALLTALPNGTLLVGGHEHLLFQHHTGLTSYAHTGSWARVLTVAPLGNPNATLQRIAVGAAGPSDAAFSRRIDDVVRAHLSADEAAQVASASRELSLGDTGRLLARAMARAAQADVGAISHTTLGTGVPAGPVSRAAMAAIIRFDGGLQVAEVDSETLATILARANQDRDIPFAQRSGDFIYANEVPVEAGRRYRVAVNGWVRLNAQRYLGRGDLAFAEASTPTLRVLLAQAIGTA